MVLGLFGEEVEIEASTLGSLLFLFSIKGSSDSRLNEYVEVVPGSVNQSLARSKELLDCSGPPSGLGPQNMTSDSAIFPSLIR